MDLDAKSLREISDRADQMREVARAIAANSLPRDDQSGIHVASLTEAVMGVTAGLHAIAAAISDLADAVRAHNA